MIEEYATDKFKHQESKTRYQDLKHGEDIIEALHNNEQPSTLISMLKRISAPNLKSSLSFLHGAHVAKLEQHLRFMISEHS